MNCSSKPITAREIAEQGTILRALVGSGVHGVAVEAHDDRDEMGVCIEPPEYVIGLRHFEQWVHRTQPEGVRSGPGDLDLTIYSLRKFCRLAANGNPSILTLLYVPREHVVSITSEGEWLQANHRLFHSREAGKRFLGYLTSQKQRLLGERGQMNVNRPELVEAYGFDTKYAGHMIRLGIQGIQFLTEGWLHLPMLDGDRELVVAVRTGKFSLNDVLTRVGEMEADLRDLIETADMPAKANHDKINEFLIEAYGDWWAGS